MRSDHSIGDRAAVVDSDNEVIRHWGERGKVGDADGPDGAVATSIPDLKTSDQHTPFVRPRCDRSRPARRSV